MTMKKNMNSERMRIVSDAGHEEAFPVNFRYVLGNEIYTIKDSYRSDNTEMRTVVSDRGDQTIMTVASLVKDAQDATFKLLFDGKEKENTEEKENEDNDA